MCDSFVFRYDVDIGQFMGIEVGLVGKLSNVDTENELLIN